MSDEPPERARDSSPVSVNRRRDACGSEEGPGRRFAPGDEACEFCGAPADGHHCKVVCPRCGAVRDCSDP